MLHDQDKDLSDDVRVLEDSLAALGLDRKHCIHTGPLIRRENEYINMNREERRMILTRMMSFIRKAPIVYKCFTLDKKFLSGNTAIHDALLQSIVRFLIDKADDLNQYDRIKLYYDNGQPQVKELLREAFAIYASKTTFISDVHPEKYRLFQAADTLCTLELARFKLQSGEHLSTSEFQFFGGLGNLNKHYFKPISRKLCK